MAIADRAGLPVAVSIASASPHECTLVEATLDQKFVAPNPERIIADRAYDSDPLDRRLQLERNIELIAPDRRNKRFKHQDLRKLRRYKRRWHIERFFAWLQNFRRTVVRYERHAENFLAMIQLACVIILLRAFLR
jgi:transposase